MTTRNTVSMLKRSCAYKATAQPPVRVRSGWSARASTRRARAQIPQMPVRISTDFTNAFTRSPVEAERLTSELLTANRPGKDRLFDAGELLHWVAASGNVQHRRTLIAGFRKAGADLAFVHHMARLPREQTTVFMTDYLKSGGALEPVMQWLSIVGNVQRSARRAGSARAGRAVGSVSSRLRAARSNWPKESSRNKLNTI